MTPERISKIELGLDTLTETIREQDKKAQARADKQDQILEQAMRQIGQMAGIMADFQAHLKADRQTSQDVNDLKIKVAQLEHGSALTRGRREAYNGMLKLAPWVLGLASMAGAVWYSREGG